MLFVLSVLLFMTTSTTLGMVLCDIFGNLTSFIAFISLLAGSGAGLLTFIKMRDRVPILKIENYYGKIMIGIFVIFIFRHFFWTVYEKDGTIFVSDTSNFVDLPNHILYLKYISRGAHFWTNHPLFINSKLTYYIGFDFFSALFTKLGVSFLVTIPALGFLSGLLLTCALYYWGGSFALGAFLFSGGAYSLKYFSTFQLQDYQLEMAWRNLLPIFSSQRGYLYAFPAGLVLLWSWRKRFFSEKGDKEKPLPMLVEGIIWGTMPFFQTYTFIFLSFVFLCWATTTKNIKASLPTFLWAFPLALYEMIRVTNWFESRHLMSYRLGWMIDHENIFMFFWNNYGFFVPLALATTYLALFHRKYLKQLAPGTILYLVCFVILFAPYDWDNNKIMIWSYLAALPIMYDLCLRPLPIKVRAAFLILLFIPGLVSVGIKSSPHFPKISIYNSASVRDICTALKDYPPEFRVATAQTHPNPVCLCGQAIVAPYPSFFWSLGRDAEPTRTNLTGLMMGDPQWKSIAKDLQAHFIFWGPKEEKTYAGSARPWENSSAKLIAQGPWGKLYDLGD